MAPRWIECVPNISEGQDLSIVDTIVSSISELEGVAVLGAEPDPDYNRTVITIAGEYIAVAKAAIILIESTALHIDMRQHTGNHPRMGAVDVCPFVPISAGTEADCILASKIVSDHFKGSIPIYKYGLIASNQDRASLANLRKGQYEGLKSRLTGGEWTVESTRMPDSWSGVWGESEERFGALSIGVRPVLIAYNVNVDEPVPVAAKAAGSIIRTSGRVITNSRGKKLRFNGMLSSVQGMGVPLPNHGICQVSMNLQDYRMTPMHHAFELIESICGDHGVSVKGSELVGLVPLQAILDSGAWYADDEDADDDDLVQAAIMGLGLDTLDEFSPEDRIIEWAIERKLG